MKNLTIADVDHLRPSGDHIAEHVAAKTKPTWYPMATAPKDGTVVLGLVKGSDIPHPMRWAGHWWQSSWDHHNFFHDAPWCWMAIPDSPNPNDLNSGD